MTNQKKSNLQEERAKYKLEPLTKFILRNLSRPKQIVADHPVDCTDDVNKNDDKLFRASNIKSVRDNPENSRMGYRPSEAEGVTEETQHIVYVDVGRSKAEQYMQNLEETLHPIMGA